MGRDADDLRRHHTCRNWSADWRGVTFSIGDDQPKIALGIGVPCSVRFDYRIQRIRLGSASLPAELVRYVQLCKPDGGGAAWLDAGRGANQSADPQRSGDRCGGGSDYCPRALTRAG